MVGELLVYFIVFAISIGFLAAFQNKYCSVEISFLVGNRKIHIRENFCLFGILTVLPVITMYSLRYGIGTDYFHYERIYNGIHSSALSEYWSLHNEGTGFFSVEPGYYLLNRISSSYRILLWFTGILMFLLILLAIKAYASQISFGLALYIFLSTQFIYSMNAARFALAFCFLLVGYVALAKNKAALFVGMVLLASLFHVSTVPCLLLVFLKKFSDERVDKIRDIALFVGIVIFPFTSRDLLRVLSNFSLFERYFSAEIYSISINAKESFQWLLHILPVILPLLLLCRKEVFDSGDTRTFFRICLMEIPFRSLGLYNTWFARYARCAQIIQVVFIPLVLSKVTNRYKRTLLIAYYIAWYVFYFCYYAVVGDKGTSLPYVWVFS